MWKTLSESVQGSQHRRADEPCQDSCLASEVRLAHETVLVLVCADGAGSAAHGRIGAACVCQTMSTLIGNFLQAFDRLPIVTRECVVDWFHRVRERIQCEAQQLDAESRQLASTFLGVIVGSSGAAFFQIGDGVIVVRKNDSYEHVFWPSSGEYVNTTHFVTDARFEQNIEFEWRDQQIDEVAVLTDGLQRLALDFHAGRPHVPFFAPIFESLRSCPDPLQLRAPLRTFLESPQVEERTDDDKTLILATRIDDGKQLL
jgi:hypothetical protein